MVYRELTECNCSVFANFVKLEISKIVITVLFYCIFISMQIGNDHKLLLPNIIFLRILFFLVCINDSEFQKNYDKEIKIIVKGCQFMTFEKS